MCKFAQLYACHELFLKVYLGTFILFKLRDLVVHTILFCFQLRDFLYLYNVLTEQCFERCVKRFHDKSLTKGEVSHASTLSWMLILGLIDN